MTDPVAGLEHDHVAFGKTVAQVKGLLARRSAADVVSDLRIFRLLESLRDDLLEHFVKEEEGLFPFLARELPDVSAEVDRLLAGHETVCGCIVRVAHCLSTGHGQDESVWSLFHRFERAYVEHARAEVVLLREVGARLDPGQRRELAALIQGL
jgi:hypothetical protein